MRERPIIFSGPMVRAILAGQKSQTRRIAKFDEGMDAVLSRFPNQRDGPYGNPGDRLWVRETFGIGYPCGDGGGWSAIPWTGADPVRDSKVFYRASFDENPRGGRRLWKPAIHMPRWASRLALEVTGVRVQRVQEISEGDARAEGVTAPWMGAGQWDYKGPRTHKEAFALLWDSINGKRAPWELNPWVWVIDFKRLEATA